MRSRADELVLHLARHQEGVLTLGQAVALGLTRDQVRQRIRSGRWERPGPGLVGMPGQPPSWQRDLMAVWLRAGRSAVVSHEWAIRLLGLDGVPLTARPRLTVPRGDWPVLGDLRLHVSRSLESVDIETVRRDLPPAVRRDRRLREAGLVRSFQVTTASRTIIDLAGSLDEVRLGALIDAACAAGRTSPAYLARRLEALRVRGRSGPTAVERALVDSGGHSVLERRFLTAIRTHGLPRPATQVVYRSNGKHLARVDFDFAPHPLVVEVSGRRGHSSDSDRDRDARRRNELQRLGIMVIEYTYARVVGDPVTVVEELSDLLSRS